MRDVELKLGKQRVRLSLDASTVILCDGTAHASRIAKALMEAGALVMDGVEAGRGTVAGQLGRKVDEERLTALVSALRVPADIADWRPRDLSMLQRLLAQSLVAAVTAVETMVFDLTHIAASPFDVAHAFAHIARVRANVRADIAVIIADPAFISSAGNSLVVMSGDELVEHGLVAEVLANPKSETLVARLEATPIPSPLAMQLRRVQRAATKRVNYAHTQIITLPTQDSIALASGETDHG